MKTNLNFILTLFFVGVMALIITFSLGVNYQISGIMRDVQEIEEKMDRMYKMERIDGEGEDCGREMRDAAAGIGSDVVDI